MASLLADRFDVWHRRLMLISVHRKRDYRRLVSLLNTSEKGNSLQPRREIVNY